MAEEMGQLEQRRRCLVIGRQDEAARPTRYPRQLLAENAEQRPASTKDARRREGRARLRQDTVIHQDDPGVGATGRCSRAGARRWGDRHNGLVGSARSFLFLRL